VRPLPSLLIVPGMRFFTRSLLIQPSLEKLIAR
jgi:hypothetical protein